MDRNCNKCIHHTSGNCSVWECTGTVTVEDVKKEALNDLLDTIKNGYDYPNEEFEHMFIALIEDAIAEQIKENNR